MHPQLPPTSSQPDEFDGPGAFNRSSDDLTDLRQMSARRSAQLRSWWDVVLRGKWLILGTLFAVLIPWAIYVMKQPNRYRASSIVLVRKQEGNLNSVLPTGGAGAMFGQNDRRVGNEMLVIRESMPLARRVAERLKEARVVPGTRERLTVLQGNPDVETLARRAQKVITVTASGRDVDGITITAASEVPGEASFISNLFAEEYVNRTQDDSRAGYRSSREFLQQQIQQLSGQLQTEEGALRSFMTSSGAVDLDQESSNLVSQLASLQAGRDEAQIELQMKRSEAEAIQRELNGIQPNIAQRLASGVDQRMSGLRTQIGENEARIEATRSRGTNDTPEVAAQRQQEIARLQSQNREMQRQIDGLSAQLLSETVAAGGASPSQPGGAGDRVTDLKRQLVTSLIETAGLEGRTRMLTQRIGQYEGDLRSIPGQAIELAQLQRARQSTERLYVALNEKLQEASVAEQSKLGYAELVRPAYRSGVPFEPNRRRNLLMGLLLGLGLGVGIAVLKVVLDHRIHRPEDLRSRGYTVLAPVPDLAELIKRDFGGQERVSIDGHSLDTRLVAVLNPVSPQAEAYRNLRTSLHFSQPDRPIRSLLVTSSNPSEGKSVTAINLATMMAQSGLRVALVDADLRKPSVHAKLGLPREPGVVELLFRDVDFSVEAFTSPIDDLYVFTAGAHVPNPSELIGSRAMRAFDAKLREHFDMVIYDSPPALVATDAPLLAAKCDATILVVSAGSTKDYELEQAAEALESVNANVVGVVLNRFDASKAYAYRYRYQNYRYRYNKYGYGYGQGDGATLDRVQPPQQL